MCPVPTGGDVESKDTANAAAEISREALTPMMQQYLETKARYPGCILFFRLGDFYEMFFEDAVNVARWLNLTLTSRAKGDDAVPMCGVPHHASRYYISKLIDMGHRVAICDQVEDPRLAKGIVKREVTRVVSPGMVLDPDLLDGKTDNFVAAALTEGGRTGLAFLDVTTGTFRITEVAGDVLLGEEIGRVAPREIVCPGGGGGALAASLVSERRAGAAVIRLEDALFGADRTARALSAQFRLHSLKSLGSDEMPLAVRAAGALLSYVKEMQKTEAAHVLPPTPYRRGEFLHLDESAVRNLEIFANLLDGRRSGSLFGILDRSETSMGGRALRHWLGSPLLDPTQINARLEAVADLMQSPALRRKLGELLSGIQDIERLSAKAALKLANARDLRALAQSLGRLPAMKSEIAGAASGLLHEIHQAMDPLEGLCTELSAAIADDPPTALNEGGIIREGYNKDLDELIAIAREGKGYIAALESREKQRTGIGSLKVRYNKVFGYYIEVTKPNLKFVPQDYFRKQTTANAERFITPELKEYEEKVSTAEERRFALEFELFTALREQVASASPRLSRTAGAVGALDALRSFAETAEAFGYARPEVDDGAVIEIEEGRHPVVERVLKDERFVPNDTRLDPDSCVMMVITGPNMAGKSTVMRQVALITLMAQAGSFVPAKRARIGVTDRIFTRIGAGDALTRGLSTFMIEMIEVATILNQATRKSLIVLDEIGRGTSTYDGLSLAWAIAEDIHDRVKARTMLATHYHELCDLALTKPGIRNFTIAIREWQGSIIFLRRLVEGGASRSYGIQVARLAGLGKSVVERAMEILRNLEAGEFNEQGMPKMVGRGGSGTQLSLFREAPAPSPVIEELQALDPEAMTPIEALNALVKLRNHLKDRKP
ncbi:MAG: DNA mismatch repair protein MutS [Deltaproteobacteria bacterium]|nr:DNA mismatch repair protein MutS [Deltaproteobacteria bacterium]